MENKALASLWIAALLLEGDDYEQAVERALKLIETHDRVLAERGIRLIQVKKWGDGIKEITGEKRLERAERKFVRFWERVGEWFLHAEVQGQTGLGVPRTPEDWRKTGFTDREVAELKYQFEALFPKRQKISKKVLGRPQKPKKARTGPV